ncbi:hypothetical protein DERP_012801 [Dermatophagoides pteronyssinus]|uniref:Uncharacterized protein n=1 Tax=Dermatophagoides pteronyssinus TaxID=6956 RepID=A0ABQ8JF73_DERPT|nr:hypothetical protein DERP_012801 [Dermatophagoides pteronyssinus]
MNDDDIEVFKNFPTRKLIITCEIHLHIYYIFNCNTVALKFIGCPILLYYYLILNDRSIELDII